MALPAVVDLNSSASHPRIVQWIAMPFLLVWVGDLAFVAFHLQQFAGLTREALVPP
jgi:hypothetical protein